MPMIAKGGDELWKAQLGSGIGAGPISYAIDGKQYIAVVVGRTAAIPAVPGRHRQADDRRHAGRRRAVRLHRVTSVRRTFPRCAGRPLGLAACRGLGSRALAPGARRRPTRCGCVPIRRTCRSAPRQGRRQRRLPGLYVEIGQASPMPSTGRGNGLVAQLFRQAQPPRHAARRAMRLRRWTAGGRRLHGTAVIFSRPILVVGYALGCRKDCRCAPSRIWMASAWRCSSDRRRKACGRA